MTNGFASWRRSILQRANFYTCAPSGVYDRSHGAILHEFREKHDDDAALFLADGARWPRTALHSSNHRFQHGTHGNRNAFERVFKETEQKTRIFGIISVFFHQNAPNRGREHSYSHMISYSEHCHSPTNVKSHYDAPGSTFTEKMTQLLLVRHGETTHNRDGIIQGQTDTELSETGERQAEILADRLADEPIDAIYSSRLRRARRTAKAISDPHDITVNPVPELAEQHLGKWQGRQMDALVERLGKQGISWAEWTPETGEPWTEFADRVLSAVTAICEKHPDDKIVVVGHSQVNKVVLAQALYANVNKRHLIEQANTCVNELRWETERTWNAKTINDLSHL